MKADRKAASVAELDPESRALLELSMLRGLSDGDLAGMLGSEPRSVRERREGVLRSLGVTTEHDRADLAAQLRGEARPVERAGAAGGVLAGAEAPVAEAPEAEPPPGAPEAGSPPGGEEAVVDDPPGDEPSPARGPRRLLWALVGGLMVAAVVALALALGSNEDPEAVPAPAQPEPPPAEPGAERPAGPPPVAFAPLGEGPGRATGQILVGAGEPRLRLAVRGLPTVRDGGYVIWLYNSISEARELTGSRKGTFSVTAPLPGEADRYRSIDISREPADGNRNHSGASVLRVPIEKIPRRSR